MKKFTKAVLLLLILSLSLTSCGKDNKESVENKVENKNEVEEVNNNSQDNEEKLSITELTELQTKNLEKLCKVWGYTKYTHSVFLFGEKDWDVELLNLMPEVYNSKTEVETNDILSDWYTSLGEIDYGNSQLKFEEWETAKEENKIVQVDLSWIKDKEYLGENLSAALSEIKKNPIVNRDKAPAYFENGAPTFFNNEKVYENMDYSDSRYRLLSLFRLWNAVEYYYPYLDIIDEDWNDVLVEYIPKIVEGNDKHSYNQTLASISTKLQEAHVEFHGITEENVWEFDYTEFGKYKAPVFLTKAEGKYIVGKIGKDYVDNCNLELGDAIIEVNGKKVEDIIEHLKKYVAIPNDEKIINKIGNRILHSKSEMIDIKVLRDNKEIELEVKGELNFYRIDTNKDKISHEIIENNIGLINPAGLGMDKVNDVMKDFENTDGIIIDLRQDPESNYNFIEKYLYDEKTPYYRNAIASRVLPGVYIDLIDYTDFSTELTYKKPVVVLMDERTQSAGETEVMRLREAENVTVMGENSVGGNGAAYPIFLPGEVAVQFTTTRVTTLEGEQTQRIGLSPDIYIEKTIKAVAEGRDEYIEEAIKYILENK